MRVVLLRDFTILHDHLRADDLAYVRQIRRISTIGILAFSLNVISYMASEVVFRLVREYGSSSTEAFVHYLILTFTDVLPSFYVTYALYNHSPFSRSHHSRGFPFLSLQSCSFSVFTFLLIFS